MFLLRDLLQSQQLQAWHRC